MLVIFEFWPLKRKYWYMPKIALVTLNFDLQPGVHCTLEKSQKTENAFRVNSNSYQRKYGTWDHAETAAVK